MDNVDDDTVILLLQDGVDETEWIRVEASKKLLIAKSEYFREFKTNCSDVFQK